MAKKISVEQRLRSYMKNKGIVVDEIKKMAKYVTAKELHDLIQNPPNGRGSPILRGLSLYGLTYLLESDFHIVARQRFDATAPLFESEISNEREYSYYKRVAQKRDNSWDRLRFRLYENGPDRILQPPAGSRSPAPQAPWT